VYGAVRAVGVARTLARSVSGAGEFPGGVRAARVTVNGLVLLDGSSALVDVGVAQLRSEARL
jgi:hypothetical protein